MPLTTRQLAERIPRPKGRMRVPVHRVGKTTRPPVKLPPAKPLPPARDVPDSLSISAVMAALNENHDDLRMTIESLRQCPAVKEIIVVDDCSTNGCCDNLDGVTVLRNAERQGCSESRQVGLDVYTGDVAAVLDPHVKFVRGDLATLAQTAYRYQAIAQPLIRNWVGAGQGPHEFYDPYLLESPKNVLASEPHARWSGGCQHCQTPTTGLYGACYVMPRAVVDKLGGWICYESFYGCSEPGMAAKAWFCDVPVVLDSHVLVLHRFKDKLPYSLSCTRDTWPAAYQMLMTLFEEKTYNDYWLPRLLKMGKIPADVQTAVDKAAQRERAKFTKVRTDEEFFRDVLGKELNHGISNT